MAGRKRASDERVGEKTASIGKTAVGLFRAKGYLETSMQDISKACRMSKGGIYHYFAAKDRILFFVLSGYMDRILEGLEEALEEIEDNADRIRFIVKRHIRLYTRYQAEAKTLLHDANCLPKTYFNVVADKERQYYRIVSGVLATIASRALAPSDRVSHSKWLPRW